MLLLLRRKSKNHPLLRKFVWFSYITVLMVETIYEKRLKAQGKYIHQPLPKQLPPTIILHLNRVRVRV